MQRPNSEERLFYRCHIRDLSELPISPSQKLLLIVQSVLCALTERRSCNLRVVGAMTSHRVLLVEDEYLIRLMAAEVLHDEGFEVIEAEDGTQAINLIDSSNGFDLLLTDVQMPGLIDGIQVALYARQRHPGIPVIVVSGQPLNARRLDDLGPRKIFVSKPYELPALVATLWSMLEAKS